jgi:hypothetical protein
MAYTIEITRPFGNKGSLSYKGSISFTCDCWWDPKDKIPQSTAGYAGCSATKMATKKNSSGEPREGILIPNIPGRTGIFIHYWPGPGSNLSAWSDGCTLVLESDMLKMYNDIKPKNGKNVTVIIKDAKK